MFPSVQINTLNLLSGEVKEIERHALFVGVTTQRETKLTSVTPDSDFEKVFGVGADEIKKQVRAAMLNAGQNWIAHVMLVPQDSYDFSAAVKKANEVASFEYAVNTHATGVDKYQSKYFKRYQ